MDDKALEKLLHEEFTGMSRTTSDDGFVDAVMQQIDANDWLALDARRPLIVGVAVLLGLGLALFSLVNLDLVLLGEIHELLSMYVHAANDSPPWYWMVLFVPLLFLTLIET